MKYLKKINEDADFLTLDSVELTYESEDAIGFMVSESGELNILGPGDFHLEYIELYLIDWEIEEEIMKEKYPYDKKTHINKEEYGYFINDKITKFIEEEKIFEYIRGRIWTEHKVIGFWGTPDKQDILTIIKQLNIELDSDLDINIDGEWQLNLKVDDNDENSFIKLKDYSDEMMTDKMRKNSKKQEVLHLNKNKNKILMDQGYRGKRSTASEWLKKGVYSKLENIKTFENFQDKQDLTLSDIVHGNFKIKLKKYNNYYTEFYIGDILVGRIHDQVHNLYIDAIMSIIDPMINLTDGQREHSSTISVKKLTKSSIKKAIREFLEDLLYIGITPIELVSYTYLDFK